MEEIKTVEIPSIPSTTTISTIAINSGKQSTIVVALLKSIGYASLRIQEMQPGMLELGENAERTSVLLAIHDDLMRKLKSKEDQVAELLARADSLVTQQKEPDVYVYEAMAESLGLAWRELNQQLQMRSFLLTETLRFYKLAEKHEELTSTLEKLLKLRTQEAPNDVSETSKQIQNIIDEIIDKTALAMDCGADVITQIRTLGAMSDNVESSQDAARTCLMIEKIMLKMAAEWEVIEERWKSEQSCKLEIKDDKAHMINAEIEHIEKWLQDARRELSERQDINSLLQQAFKHRTTIKNLLASTAQYEIDSGINERLKKLRTEVENFLNEIRNTKNENDKVIAWIASAKTMLNQLRAMKGDMRNANAAIAGELAPLARQKAQVVIDDGRRILHLNAQVEKSIAELENELKKIDDLARKAVESSRGRFNEQLYRLETWLSETESIVTRNNHIGSKSSEASDFCSLYKSITTDTINRESEINTLMNKINEFDATHQKRLIDLQNHFEHLKQIVDSRINLATAFQQVHKFAKELESSFESLTALITANRAFTNEKLTVQMKEIFQMIEETLMQEKHQGEKFVENANWISSRDSQLSIGDAVNSVNDILNNHQQQFANINETWTSWQLNRVNEQKVVRIVEEVQMWQEETIEIIRNLEDRLDSSRILVEEYEEMKRIVDEMKLRLPTQYKQIVDAQDVSKQLNDEERLKSLSVTMKKHYEIEEKLSKLYERLEIAETSGTEQKIQSKPPVIVEHLRDAQIDEGKHFEFIARVDGIPVPEINWYKDGRNVNDNIDYRTAFLNGTATLTIDETFAEDTAIYTVRATNADGIAESSAKLTVHSHSEIGAIPEEQTKPQFIRQLRNIIVNEGDDVFLDCVLVGKPEPKVVWYKEEEIIKESDRIKLHFDGDHCSLLLNDARISDSSLYTVKANNTCGQATNFCRLTVQAKHVPPITPPKPQYIPYAPSFNVALSNQIVQKGQQALFEAKIFGEPKPFVTWKFNDSVKLESTHEIRIEEMETGWHRLLIEHAQPQNAGMYTIIAQNEVGEARSGATLNVEQQSAVQRRETAIMRDGFWSDSALMSSPTPPPIPRHREFFEKEEFIEKQTSEIGWSPTATVPEFVRPFQNEYTVTEGEKLRMDCMMIGNPRPKVYWYFNDQIINLSSRFCTLSNIGDTYSIILEPAKLEHAGVYKMTAENIRGRTESVFVLRVRPQSQKSTTTEHVRVIEEFGAYEYQQRVPDHRGAIIESQTSVDRRNQEEEQRRNALKQHSTRLLTPPPAKKQQLLSSTHSQQRKFSERYESEEKRQIGRPPHFSQTLVSAVAICGDQAFFEGVVTGLPTPEITWTKDGEPVLPGKNPELIFSNIGGRVSLYFSSTQLEHAGKYMCSAKNASGVATSSAQLVVRPKTVAPDFVRRLISEEVAEGERLKWTVQVTGDPPPSVVWLRDGQIIPNCSEVNLINEGDCIHSMVIVQVELADCGQFTCLAENVAGEARSTADLVVRPKGTEPGNYFHVTKVTQEKKINGEEINRNESFAIENPRKTPINY